MTVTDFSSFLAYLLLCCSNVQYVLKLFQEPVMTPKKEPWSRFYRHRNPESLPFCKIVEKYFDEFEQVYPERYGMRFGFLRPVIREAIDKLLE